MSERYKVIDSNTPTFVTITIVDWVDLFTKSVYCKILDESLNFCSENKGLRVHAYVYMTSHIHMIVSSEVNDLQDIIRDFKKYTSKSILRAIEEYSPRGAYTSSSAIASRSDCKIEVESLLETGHLCQAQNLKYFTGE